MELKTCPFCGSDNLGISLSTGNRQSYYKQVYCKKCHTYGPRYRLVVYDRDRSKIDSEEESDNKAMRLWNNRLEKIRV